MNIQKIFETGLNYAQNDLIKISRLDHHDVKPKEDQIKCSLYRAFSEAKYLVKAETGYSRSGDRCDLIAIDLKMKGTIAIEIKTAWAGKGWINKPKEQVASWYKDIEKLTSLQAPDSNDSGYFVICFIYQKDSKWEEKIRAELDRLNGRYFQPFSISDWNGLDYIQFCVVKVFGE